MRILRIKVAKLGPFSTPIKIELDPRVTILTGANDAGKTSLLRALRLLLQPIAATEQDVNRDHVFNTFNAWDNDTQYSLEADFTLTQLGELVGPLNPNHLPSPSKPWTGHVQKLPSPNVKSVKSTMSDGQRSWSSDNNNIQIHLPTCIAIGFDEATETIRSLIPLDTPNALEKALLRIAFVGQFNLIKLRALSLETWEEVINRAEETLNAQAHRVLPKSNYFRFRFRSIDDSRMKLAVSIRDAHQSSTPFDFRGNGARKMITILTRLLVEGTGAHHRIVLIDEPENSLHADAQHLIREFLHDLCVDGKTQVVYSTHSPSMLNPLRPHQIRLLERARIDEVATTVIAPRPEELGFASVRASWGLTAVDSLLYGPVTVIVEGPTEVNCIPIICGKLAKANIVGFEEQERLLGLSHFLDGRGQNHTVVAKLAEAQGTRVVVFLDGDNHAAEIRRKLQEQVPNAKIVLLPDGKEFEDLIKPSRYFEAMASELGVEPEVNLQEKYDKWLSANPHKTRYAFSKRVAKWLESEFPEKEALVCKRKPEIMRAAVELSEADEILADNFLSLLTAILEQLSVTSFAR